MPCIITVWNVKYNAHKMLAVCLDVLDNTFYRKIHYPFSKHLWKNINVQTTISFSKSSNVYLVFAEFECPVLGTKISMMTTITTTPTAPHQYSKA